MCLLQASTNSTAVHTSGTSVLDDGSKGEYKGDRIYYDDKPEDIDALDDNAPHRQVDLEIVRARRELGDAAKMVIVIRECAASALDLKETSDSCKPRKSMAGTQGIEG